MEGKAIRVSIHSDRKTVKVFLKELRDTIESRDFTIDEGLIIIQSRKAKQEYSTSYTLVDLDYDSYDIISCLKQLTISDYSETLIDKDNNQPPLLFVFGKEINDRLVYIKLKLKNEVHRRILCLSFHYAEYEMEFPYIQIVS